MQYICDFWLKHQVGVKCECKKVYWVRPVMRDRLKEMWNDFIHHKQITDWMRQEFLNDKYSEEETF